MRRSSICLAALLTLAACDSDPADQTEVVKETYACELGMPGEDGAFVPLSENDRAELVLGFQGFLFVTLLVRAQPPAPALVDITVSVTLQDTQPFGASQLGTALHTQSGDALITGEIVIFFESSNVSLYQDREAALALRLEDAAQTCTITGTVLLVNDNPCIYTDDPICPEEDEL